MARGEGGGTKVVDQRPSVAERCDLGDDSHDTHGERVDMRVHVDDLEMMLKALTHIQCQETNMLLN